MREYGKVEAEKFIIDKQSMEVGVAFDLLEVFDKELILPVREMCKASIVLVDDSLGGSVKFRVAFKDKWLPTYACFQGYSAPINTRPYTGPKEPGWNADTLLKLVDTWTASKCGDWIRVYGEIVEEKFFGDSEDQLRTSYQRGPSGSWSKPKTWEMTNGLYNRGKSLSQPDFQKDSLRRRVAFKALSLAQKGIYTNRLTHSHELMSSMPHAGSKKWAVMANDTTGKMAEVFGLMPGATISGTTTDNMYFISKFAFAVSDPALYLLPFGTIVSGGHHSLLEVALPLAINECIDYSVGCYSTLIPEITNTPAARIIRNFLQAYDNRLENRLILAYYQGANLDGCFVCESPAEKFVWKTNFKANKSLMEKFIALQPHPNRSRVESLAAQHGLYPEAAP